MKCKSILQLAFVGGLLLTLPAKAVYSQVAPAVSEGNQTAEQLSVGQLRDRAEAVTVKILAGQTWGSGTLIAQEGTLYTVITNAHVLRAGSDHRLQTRDGKIHAVVSTNVTQFGDDDLALMQFRSSDRYQVAKFVQNSPLRLGEETYAAGFPASGSGSDTQSFTFTRGAVTYLLSRPFLGGYQVGYSNEVYKGMSGGPVFNRAGEVVAINGRHKYPLWGNNYIFEDGSTPEATERQQMEASSWAIPIQTILQQTPQMSARAFAPFESQTQAENLVTAETFPSVANGVETGIFPEISQQRESNRPEPQTLTREAIPPEVLEQRPTPRMTVAPERWLFSPQVLKPQPPPGAFW